MKKPLARTTTVTKSKGDFGKHNSVGKKKKDVSDVIVVDSGASKKVIHNAHLLKTIREIEPLEVGLGKEELVKAR